VLTEAGHTVLEATHGTVGLHVAEEHVPSVVVANDVLPDMSGLVQDQAALAGMARVG
jgi:DNA-binding response OmpR family regulator